MTPIRYLPSYEMAMAAGRDAGNRSAKDAGRTAWNDADWGAAREVFNRIQDITRERLQDERNDR
jgi:hypothetical protein